METYLKNAVFMVFTFLINSHPVWQPKNLNCSNTFATFYIVNSEIEGKGKQLIVASFDF